MLPTRTLCTTLHGLRKSLGNHLLADDETLALDRTAEVDARTFLTNIQYPISYYPTPPLAIETLTKTLAIYHGEFFEGFSLPDSALILSGAARELEQSLPYQPVIEALRSLFRHPSWATLHSRINLSPFWLEETARLLPELVSFAPGQTFTLRGREPRPGLPGLPGPAAESRLLEGITRPVVLDVEFVGQAKSPWGTTSAGFLANTKIDRTQWDLTWNQVLETGGVLVGNEIGIYLEMGAIKQAVAVPA